MKKEELEAWARRHGYSKDRHGHFRKDVLDPEKAGLKKYRLHISQNAARKELHCEDRWIRLRSGYLKNLSIDENDRLAGLTTQGC